MQTVTRTLTLAGLLLAALAVSAVGQKDDKDKAKDKPKDKLHKTPEACFDAVVAALEKKDSAAMVASLTPKAQNRMALEYVGQGIQLRGVAEGKLPKDKGQKNEQLAKLYKPLFDVLDKHGLTEKATKDLETDEKGTLTTKGRGAALKLVKDPVAFLSDMLAATDKLDTRPKDKDEPKPKLTDVKIDGDKATGTVIETIRIKQKDKDDKVQEEKHPVRFEKVDGGWRLDPSPDEKKDKEAKDKKDK